MTKSKRAHLYPAADDPRWNEILCETWDGSELPPATIENGDWGRYHDLVETVVAATWHADIGTWKWIADAIGLLNFGINHGRTVREGLQKAIRP